jgi:hypothetical protein
MTRTLMGLMTPGYASPEQANGAGITTLTCVQYGCDRVAARCEVLGLAELAMRWSGIGN